MYFNKRVQKVIKSFCRWNVSNIYEPQNAKKLEMEMHLQVGRLAVESGEWKKYTNSKLKKNHKVLK